MAQRGAARRGFTLTEITVVLGIVGIVIGGIWTAAGMVSYNRLIQQEKSDLLHIVSGMQSLYGQKGFSNFTLEGAGRAAFFDWQKWDFTRIMVKYDVYPSDLPLDVTNDNPLRGGPYNREGGRIQVWPWSNSVVARNDANEANRMIEVSFNGIPRTCERLAFETSRLQGAMAPVQMWSNAPGFGDWKNPADTDFSTWSGCTAIAWAFKL